MYDLTFVASKKKLIDWGSHRTGIAVYEYVFHIKEFSFC